MKITAKFTTTDGGVIVATFDAATKTVTDTTGRKGTYTADPGTRTIDIKGDQAISFTAADPVQFTPGFTTTFVASTGKSGTVVIEKVE